MRGPRLSEALRLARTVRHLRPAQIAHRLRLRSQRQLLRRLPSAARLLRRPVPRRCGWPEAFVPIDARLAGGFPSPHENAAGTFTFLGETRALGDPPDWSQEGASQLWRYHLHYLDWVWSFAAGGDVEWSSGFSRIWRSWQDGTRFGAGEAWSPYVASLRAWNLCGVFSALAAGTEIETAYLLDLALHAGFVRAHLELDVGGNHLMKNVKALLGLGLFLHDDELVALGRRHLARQLPIQVLGDGGHFERSPSYHCQVLADLMDMRDLLGAAGSPPVAGLDQAVTSMREWLGAMLMPDGGVPLFNDCTLVGTDRLALLCPLPPPDRRLIVLRPSGYVVMRPQPGAQLVADVGLPCPPGLPAHAHADCLSFELAIGGRRVIVDTGTSTYEPGRRRAYERSTRAHNTIVVDGRDQTEVWGTFRAGRRAHPRLEGHREAEGLIEVTGSHDGYRHLPGRPRHRRTWRWQGDRLEIEDEVDGRGRHHLELSLHLAEELPTEKLSIAIDGPPGAVVTRHAAGECSLDGWHATNFGVRQAGVVVRAGVEAELPARLRTVVSWREQPSSSPSRRIPSPASDTEPRV